MRRRSTQILTILLVLVLVLAAAGCGKKKTTTTTTRTTVTESTTTAAATTTTAETTTTSGTTTSAAGIGALSGDCKQLSNLSQEFSTAFSGANGDVQKQVGVLKAFADKTPADIRPDFETIASFYAEVANDLKGVNVASGQTPDAATLAKLMTLSQKLKDSKFQAALQHIETWAANGCRS
jgi:hypothetical protein